MTPENAPISLPPTLQLEEMFVKLLKSDPKLAALPIVAGSDRDALVPPLHCFVLCRSVTPVLEFGQNYRADLVIIVASNIDDQVHKERKDWFSKVLNALTRREPPFVASHGVLLGWPLVNITETSEGQQTGDVVTLAPAFALAG